MHNRYTERIIKLTLNAILSGFHSDGNEIRKTTSHTHYNLAKKYNYQKTIVVAIPTGTIIIFIQIYLKKEKRLLAK